MTRTKCPSNIFRSILLSALLSSLSACGGGSGETDSSLNGPLADPANLAVGTSTVHTGAGQSLTEFNPIMSVSDDDIAAVQDTNNFIEEQWQYMQTCLQQVALKPDVEIVDGDITPVAGNDEVIRHIDGKIHATAHVTDTGASIQISAADFDGSIGKPGSYLRSIMGRYLWLSANLSERDYPYRCALGE